MKKVVWGIIAILVIMGVFFLNSKNIEAPSDLPAGFIEPTYSPSETITPTDFPE